MRYYGIAARIPASCLLLLTCIQFAFGQSRSAVAPFGLSLDEHWIFLQPEDTITGTWNRILQLHRPLFGVSSYYLQNVNKVFICGGIDSQDNPKTECYMFNPGTNSYEPKDTLPTGRAYGKLVKVKNYLYLVGSVSNFNSPDGALYRYDPSADEWELRAPVPSPVVHEMAVCVWRDSLIIAIGGSTGGFGGALNSVRIYEPVSNSWRILSGTNSVFPVNITAAQAECIGNTVVVVGGFNSGSYNRVYKGQIVSGYIDTLNWYIDTVTATPFGTGVYRLGSGRFGNYMVFGPALSSIACINQLWGFDLYDSTWTRFVPNTLDVACRTTVAVKHTADSLYFFLFGGITRDTSGTHFISFCEKYSTGNPVIGIAGNKTHNSTDFVLHRNFPNPFNPLTKIIFEIPHKGTVSMTIYNILGERIMRSENKILNAGRHEFEFDGTKLTSGVYFYSIIYENSVKSGKMVLLK